MDFNRWFWTDDTPRWKRRVTMFLWVSTLAFAVTLMVWAFWYS